MKTLKFDSDYINKELVGIVHAHCIHAFSPRSFGYTLCGCASESIEDDSYDDIVDCPECIELIRFCKNLKYGKDYTKPMVIIDG